MKSLLFLVCCLGVLAEFELRTTHVAQAEAPHVSHLPDESNFQASGGAALGSFGGFTRVIVLLVVFLGVLYHGFVPGHFGPEARPSGSSLPMRKLSDQRDDSIPSLVLNPDSIQTMRETGKVASPEIRTEVMQKINKQATKKLAKKAAKKLLEAVKAVEEKKAPVAVGVEKKKNTEKLTKKETVFENVEKKLALKQAQTKEDEVEVKEMQALKEVQMTKEVQVVKEKTEGQHAKWVAAMVEEERQQELIEKSKWVENPPRVFERTSVTIKRAKRMLNVGQLLSERQTRTGELLDLDFDSFVVDPRTVNCPVFMKLAAGPLVLEETCPLDIAEQETPASIEPVRDKVLSPVGVPEFVPRSNFSELAPKSELPGIWGFNSHKKTVWMQRQTRSTWPVDAMPESMALRHLPWSPIRTPCKFAAACKKPGCQFTHPSDVPAWAPPVF
jgi:hypothetical protein